MPRKRLPPPVPRWAQFDDDEPDLSAFLPRSPLNQSNKPDLTTAKTLMDFRNWDAAYNLLLELHAAQPTDPAVLDALAEVTWELGDLVGYERALMQLNALQPNDAAIALELAEAHTRNGRIVLGLNLYRRFVERWPNHDQAAETRALIGQIAPNVQELIESIGINGPDATQWASQHERIQLLLAQGEIKQARAQTEQLLKKHPTFIPALNNLSLIYWADDKPDQAIATAQRALNHERHNVDALANLTRFLFLRGDHIAAQTCAAQLQSLPPNDDQRWHKHAEALSYLGDDDGVLAVFARAKKGRKLDDLHPLLHHLAAVAYARQGDGAAAKRLWARAKKLLALDVIKDNLANLRLPASEQHSAWPFNVTDWLSPERFLTLARQMDRALERDDDAAMDTAMARFLARNPDILALIPSLLDRGDPNGCEMAFNLAASVRSPAMLDALPAFAFGQRGNDHLRYLAASVLQEAGRLADNKVRLWLNGAWQDVMLLSFEVYAEGTLSLPPAIAKLLQEGIDVMRTDPAQSEQLLGKARDLAPDVPQIQYNLSLTYMFQGRTDEAAVLVRAIVERFPDYFFGQVAVARLEINAGDYAAATARLQPLISRGRFHINEASALCDAQIGLLAAQENYEAIEPWLDIWRSFAPDHPGLDFWESTLTMPIAMARMRRERQRRR